MLLLFQRMGKFLRGGEVLTFSLGMVMQLLRYFVFIFVNCCFRTLHPGFRAWKDIF